MSEISEFTEIKNDGACDGLRADQYPKFEIKCPKCNENSEFKNDGYWHCPKCGEKFVTERFILDD
jgi:Zn finger protein HypA/HybF involved in hydrogenase expression